MENGGANKDHESTENGGCDDDKHDHEKDEDVDHENVKEQNAVSVEAAVSVDDVSAGEEMVTAAEEDITDPGTYSIAEEILRVIF